MVKNESNDPTECPVCGDHVPRGAPACPGCGADERSGWNEETTRYDGLDLPDTVFTDDKTGGGHAHPRGVFWIVVAAGLLVLLILGIFLR